MNEGILICSIFNRSLEDDQGTLVTRVSRKYWKF